MTDEERERLDSLARNVDNLIEIVRGSVDNCSDLLRTVQGLQNQLHSIELRLSQLEFNSADPKKVN